jgi:hypothetical protein
MRNRFDEDELHWYALDVMRQKEYVAAYLLQRRFDCMTFVPTATRFRKRSRYVKSEHAKLEVAYPALPGAVFCGFASAPPWFHLMQMNLVNGVLSMDGRPRRIDTSGMEWIRYRSRQLDGNLVVERQTITFRGQEVERSASLVHIQGRGVLRSPMSIKAKAAGDRPVVIRPTGERAKIMERLFGQPAENMEIAA